MSEWISVKDRLPEKNNERYLAVTNSSWGRFYKLLHFATCLEEVDEYDFRGENGSGFYNYDSEYGYCKVDDVTHWMPLPKLPEE